MKAIIVTTDSLNRRTPPPYARRWAHAPHFERLVRKNATFDSCLVGSAPRTRARREISGKTARRTRWDDLSQPPVSSGRNVKKSANLPASSSILFLRGDRGTPEKKGD